MLSQVTLNELQAERDDLIADKARPIHARKEGQFKLTHYLPLVRG